MQLVAPNSIALIELNVESKSSRKSDIEYVLENIKEASTYVQSTFLHYTVLAFKAKIKTFRHHPLSQYLLAMYK